MARILVIEDDKLVREMLKEMLERNKYEVTVALEGNEGIASYREKKADIVITDIIMPGKEGVETIIDLQREFPEVKIIAISGGGFGNPIDYLKAAKMFSSVKYAFAKPFLQSEILQAIESLLVK
jgi:CheY-like chemotaxis protein